MDPRWRTLLALFLTVCRLKISMSMILESIHWNTSNTRFVPGKGITVYPQIGDKLDIVCPRLMPGHTTSTRIEYFRVYLVTQEQLESCKMEKGNVALLNCDKPDQEVKFTFKFQEFSPNLWGLEFIRGKDYYIISTSNSSLEGLDNLEGGVCETKSMKMILRVGQRPSDTAATKEHPKHSETDQQSTSSNDDVFKKIEQDKNGGESVGVSSSEVALFTGVASGAFVLVVLVIVVLVVFARRRRRKNSARCSPPLPLHPIPKRSNNNNGSERSDIIFPLRASDSYYCPHYEKVSGDYGHPVYIVQEMEPQNPANVYYKV
ncbi:ephrin-B2b precursor [Silurus asotus]|uniref:Ephrin-B2b n=1 Tax=Silurus asotus TaxID=30991 RepID=A0AAD5AHV9_SILAS|nr:ephrin-B2b precursor [Silurus asotus]